MFYSYPFLCVQALDINSDGYISKPEMIAASQRTGRRLSKTEVEATFREYDQNKDNKLSYSEFCVLMNRRRTSEKDVEHAEDRRGDRAKGGPAPRDSSKKYQVDKKLH